MCSHRREQTAVFLGGNSPSQGRETLLQDMFDGPPQRPWAVLSHFPLPAYIETFNIDEIKLPFPPGLVAALSWDPGELRCLRRSQKLGKDPTSEHLCMATRGVSWMELPHEAPHMGSSWGHPPAMLSDAPQPGRDSAIGGTDRTGLRYQGRKRLYVNYLN